MLVMKSAIQCTWSQQMFTFLIVTELFRSVPCYHCVNNKKEKQKKTQKKPKTGLTLKIEISKHKFTL